MGAVSYGLEPVEPPRICPDSLHSVENDDNAGSARFRGFLLAVLVCIEEDTALDRACTTDRKLASPQCCLLATGGTGMSQGQIASSQPECAVAPWMKPAKA